jgi:hypothetical protein
VTKDYADTRLESARVEVASALTRLEGLFTSDARLTFIMRSPISAERYMIITSDDLREVEKTIARDLAKGPGK